MPTSSSKRSHPEDSTGSASLPGNTFDMLHSIDKMLASSDARLSLLEILHKLFQALRESLELNQQQLVALIAENEVLRRSAKSITEEIK